MYTDYQCQKCKFIFLQKKQFGEKWPEKTKCPKCLKNEGMRIYNKCPVMDVASGKTGNAKNGYESEITYQPSIFTPNSISRKKTGTDSMAGDKFGGYGG